MDNDHALEIISIGSIKVKLEDHVVHIVLETCEGLKEESDINEITI